MDTVEKLINRLPQEQCEFLLYVRDIVLSVHPEMTEKLSFSTAFFSCRGWVAYFNALDSGGFEINFCKGHLLTNKHNKLIARNRKVVRGLVFPTPADFDEQLFRETLEEAVALNLQKKKPGPRQAKLI
jgi:hypothetical protein